MFLYHLVLWCVCKHLSGNCSNSTMKHCHCPPDELQSNYRLISSPFSSFSEGAHHTHPVYWCLHLHSPQPYLHHRAEHKGGHSSDSDPLLARTFWEHLTLQQSTHSFQCNTSWTNVLVEYLLQFWYASLWLWYLLLYIQHQFCFIIHCDKWLSGSFNKHHRG